MGTPFKLRNGMLLLSTEAPGGIYNSTQLKKIAALCDGDSALVKATEDQRLALFVVPSKAKAIADELQAVGLGIRDYQNGLHQPINCIGELCGEHLQDAMGTAMDLSQELAKVTLGSPLKIGINGCARCCVPTHTLDISIIGDMNGYRVSLGGKTSQLPEMASFMAEGVPAAELPKLVAKVIKVYKDLAQPEESLQELIERSGAKPFIDSLAPYSQDAHQGSDPFALAEEPADASLGASEGVEQEQEVLGTSGNTDSADEVFSETAFDPAAEADAEILHQATDDVHTGLDDELAPGLGADVLNADDIDINPAEFGSNGAGSAPDVLIKDEVVSDPLADDFGDPEASWALDSDNPPADLEAVEASDDLQAPEMEMEMDAGAELLMADEHQVLTESEVADELEALEDLPEPSTEALSAEVLVDGSEPQSADADFSLADDLVDIEDHVAIESPASSASAAAVALEDGPAAHTVSSVEAGEQDKNGAQDQELAAEEVGEDEADAFEEKLNASIAEEEAYPTAEDVNSEDRLEAMRLVEGGEDASQADLHTSEAEAEAEAEVEARLDTESAESVADDDITALEEMVETSDIDDDVTIAAFEPELIGPSDLGEADPVGSVQQPVTPFASPRIANRQDGQAGALSSVDIAADGRLNLQFASGVQVSVDPASFIGQTRQLMLAGQQVRLTCRDGGFAVEVDGVAIFLPENAA